MVNYECQRCGYQTTNKSYLKRHLLRKNLCKPIMNEIDRYNLLISYGFDEESKMYEKITQSNSNTSSKSNSFKCKYCNKKYKYKQGKWKHEQNCNEKNKNDELSLLKEQNKILLDRDKQRDKEILENKKEMRKMMKLIEQLMTKSSNVNNGVINNAQQQITDKRLKNDLGDCEYGLSEIMQVQPKKYTWKEGPEDQQPTIGFFAQDVHPIMPEAAPREAFKNEKDEDDYKWGLNSQTIIAALVNATKEQQTMIEDLKKEIEQLKS